MTRREQKTGKTGEAYAAVVLSSMGIQQLERVGTPVKMIASKVPGLFKVIFGEKVIADYRGVLPGGRSVLAEVKTILHGNLQYSAFRPHQPAGLTRHADLGGLSLVVWVSSDGIFVMSWPIPDFEPHHGLTTEMAQALDLKYVNLLAISPE